MTVSDLRDLMSDVFDEKLSEIIDPDAGIELRDDIRERLIQQSKDFAEGKFATVSFSEVLGDLGIDRAEIETEEYVPAKVC